MNLILLYFLLYTLQIITPFIIIIVIYRLTKKVNLLILDFPNSIFKLILGKQFFISRKVQSIIKEQRKQMINDILKTNDKSKRIEIENYYTIETVRKIRVAYDEGQFTISEIGYRLNILNSDVNYFMCIFTGIIASIFFELTKSYFKELDEFTQKNMANSNSIVMFTTVLIMIIFFLFIIVIFLYYFRRSLVISLNKDPIFDEAEKHIINEILKKHNITCE